jgi:type IV pilus assembly protein PilM
MEMIATLLRKVPGCRALVNRFANLDWKRLLKLQETQVFGLDVGSSAVRIVQLRKDSSAYTVIGAGIVHIESAEGDDNSNNETNTIKAIHQCLESAGVKSRLAVCGVSGPEVAVRHFEFPALSPEEIEGAVLLEAAQVCPFNIDDATVDYQLTPNGDNTVSGVLVAATNKLIRKKEQLIKDASLDCIMVDVDGLAILNCFNECQKPEERGKVTVILNVGSSYTNLTIMGESGRPFTREMTYAGNDIVNAIASEKEINPETVSRILTSGEDSGRSESELGDSLARACRKLIVGVTETLRYYSAQEKSGIVEKIFVCGGFALVKGFVELLDSQLPASAVLLNPFDTMSCDSEQDCQDILQKNGPALAVAAGLAMRSI